MKPTMKKVPVMLTTIALAGQLTLPAVAATPLAPRSYEGSVNITEAFRDQKLQSWLLNAANLGGAGADGVLTQEERMAVTQLDLSGLGLTSLEGLGAFPNLQSLNCSNNSLTELDVSQNPRLTMLSCASNRLTSLELSANKDLEYLNCNFNRIGSLDLTGHDSRSPFPPVFPTAPCVSPAPEAPAPWRSRCCPTAAAGCCPVPCIRTAPSPCRWTAPPPWSWWTAASSLPMYPAGTGLPILSSS